MSNSIGVETPTARQLFRSAQPSDRETTGTRGEPVRRRRCRPAWGFVGNADGSVLGSEGMPPLDTGAP
jgi:hypothetical protein